MRNSGNDTSTARQAAQSFSVRLSVLIAALSVLSFVVVPSAFATGFETVGHFGGALTKPAGEFPEEAQLGGVSGLAVNTTGAGGVEPGTVYAMTRGEDGELGVARFGPAGNFELRWQPRPGGSRCGPATEESANPDVYTHCPSHPQGGVESGTGVAVDQATGNLYAMSRHVVAARAVPIVYVFNPDGTKLIAEFGEVDTNGTVAESPSKFHLSVRGLAVNDSGVVYVPDEDKEFVHRIMVFEPQTPGDYEHYVYAGQGHDIAVGKPKTGAPGVSGPALDMAGNIYGQSGELGIFEYDPAQPSTPVCSFSLPAGGILAQTVNPVTGDVFYSSYKNKKIHQLRCNNEGKFIEVGAFEATPERGSLEAMTMDGGRKYAPDRPAGVLYGATPRDTSNFGSGGEPGARALGYVFAPPLEIFPSVESESVSSVTSSTASLAAQINPMGSLTNYGFQYLDDAAYEANEPDERQSLTVSAVGGVFGLGLEGHRLGGEGSGTLTAGSKTVGALVTTEGTATLKGAVGTGTLKGAEGKGTFIAGSSVISSVSASEGKFEVGQGIAGAGILTGDGGDNAVDTTITGVTPENGLSTFEITISSPATKTAVGTKITSAATSLTEAVASEGSFEVGQTIEGGSIPLKTTITAIEGNELALSRPPVKPAVGFGVHAGSSTLTNVSPSLGSFEVGQPIKGEGIPSGTEVRAVSAGELTLSRPVIKPGTGVAISSQGPAPWAVGEQVEGPGVPASTFITSIRSGEEAIKKGDTEATLSNAATASGTGVVLRAGLSASASAARVREALEGLPTIGEGNAEVSGGPGDETGSNPYEITFVGKLENVDVPQLSADASGLDGGLATANVETAHNGGSGFAGALEAPLGGAELGEEQIALPAAVALSGLAPDTGYHFRAVATSHCSALDEAKVCEDAGASQAFHTAPSEAPKLPDSRAWELVSPAQKNGGEVIPASPEESSCGPECKPGVVAERFPMQSSPDGEGVVYEGFPFSPGKGAVRFNEYLSKRSPSGWQTAVLSPQLQESGEDQGYKAFDTALTRGLLLQRGQPLTPEAPGAFASLYSQDTTDPLALSSLLSAEPPNRQARGEEGFTLTYAGASSNLSRVFFEANDALTEETPFAPEAADGGVNKKNLYEWSEEGLRLVNVLPGDAETNPGAAFGSGLQLADPSSLRANFSHAISTDGSRAFWSSESGQVYVRENGETTREISDHTGKFLTASADGSKLLLNDGHLLELDNGEQIVDLTEGKGGFRGIAGQSEDLSHIYFVDTQVLDETPNKQGNFAREGENNLYVWRGGATAFVAKLAPNDNSGGNGVESNDWDTSPSRRSAEASPNGRWLAFLSRARLTGYDNIGACEYSPTKLKFVPSAACSEAFLYDADTGKLTCVSCNPSNERPQGPTRLRKILNAEGSLPQPRYLSDSGRMYFDTANSLSPFDTNGNVEDVYQYEPGEVGNCKRAGGCVSLISAGHEPIDSNFLTMDPSGKNVFFTTRDQLSLKDKDELVDLYDAREGGGIPAETETARVECQGEACQAPVSTPNDPTPGSSTFQGAGNVTEPKAAKKHAKKHKKKHTKKKHAHKRAAKHNRGGAK